MNRYGVSIIICCHNGADRLPETIRHIAEQRVPAHISWELLLIDNNSTDDSIAVANNEWSKYSTSAVFRIIREPALGLSYARSRGFAEAKYEYMIMCDDDNWLAPDYVSTVFKIMSTRPRVGALGGNGTLLFETEAPAWLPNSHIFAGGPQAPVSGKVSDNKVYGAGCVIRKSAYQKLEEVGFKTFLTDRKGHQLSSGGDYELCYALSILGYDIWYDERLQFKHYITKERLTFDYFIRYAKESSKCVDVLFSYKYIAGKFAVNEVPAVVIGRNLFYFVRRFLMINMKRLVAPSDSKELPLLVFRHVALKCILITFFLNFRKMVNIHKALLDFKQVCINYRNAAKANEPQVFTPSIEEAVWLKPFRRQVKSKSI